MDQRSEHMIAYTPQSSRAAVEPAEVEVDPEVPGNPVGELNDICMRTRIPPPRFEVKRIEPAFL